MICSSARLKESDVVGSGLYELWEGLEFCLEMAFDICDIDDDAQPGLLMIILIYIDLAATVQALAVKGRGT